ncbi:MAG: preprotein translocase subunit YajC [Muribaculaceae bacterium]|nr:preprotein translocase subunit YajC [Muribaculaceae bacterium]
MTTLTSIMLEAAPVQPEGTGMSSILMIVALFVVFYFFMIRPQNKERKRMRDFINSLAVGDKVKTASGVYGKIKEIKDTCVYLEVADNVKIKVDKNYIVAPAENPAQETKK